MTYGKTLSVDEGIALIEASKTNSSGYHEVPIHFKGKTVEMTAQPAEKSPDILEKESAGSVDQSKKPPGVSDYLNGKIRIRWDGVYNR